MSGGLKDGEGLGEAALLELVELPGQQEHEGELDNLSRLEIDGKAGDVNPALVAVCPLDAQRREGEQYEDDVEDEQELPGLLGDELNVHRGKEDIDQDAQEDGGRLDQDLSVVVAQIARGAENKHQAIARRGDAQAQEKQIAFLKELADRIAQPGQWAASFLGET